MKKEEASKETIPITLRDYQKECVDIINTEGKTGRHLVALATGLGKTVIFANIKRSGRMLILSHRDELVRQPQKYFSCSFGVEKSEEHATGEEVVSASVQTLYQDSRLTAYAPDAFHTIVIDEAHHAAAPSYRKILDYFSGAKQIIGVTATPKRGDNVRLSDVFDEMPPHTRDFSRVRLHISGRKTQKTIEKRTKAFQDEIAEEKESLTHAKSAFPKFEEALLQQYDKMKDSLKMAEQQRKESAIREKEQVSRGYFVVPRNMEYAQMEGNATPAQVSFAESLCSQMSRKGYLFCKKPDFGQMSKTEISIMIDAMKYINSHYHQRTEDRLVFREECEQNVQNAAQSGEAEVKFPFSVES